MERIKKIHLINILVYIVLYIYSFFITSSWFMATDAGIVYWISFLLVIIQFFRVFILRINFAEIDLKKIHLGFLWMFLASMLEHDFYEDGDFLNFRIGYMIRVNNLFGREIGQIDNAIYFTLLMLLCVIIGFIYLNKGSFFKKSKINS